MSYLFIRKQHRGFLRFSAIVTLAAFSINLIVLPTGLNAQTPLQIGASFSNSTGGGIIKTPTNSLVPPLLKGIKVFPDNPLRFDFIIDSGQKNFTKNELKEESTKLIKYFLAALTVPDDDFWVNLSPYEKDRIIPEKFGSTEMGHELLEQDFVLKRLAASLIYPENELGKEFWDKVYAKVKAIYGTTRLPVNTFNKVWIVPEKAQVYENGDTAFVVSSHLKVMIEKDYLSFKENFDHGHVENGKLGKEDLQQLNDVSSRIVKEVILPEIEKEVNTGEIFASLRQVYNSLILAVWFKRNLKKSFLDLSYVGKNKIDGVDIFDRQSKEKIYKRYLETFKSGVYNYIKEDFDLAENKTITRKYFSGGMAFTPEAIETAISIMPKSIPEISEKLAESAVGPLDMVSVVLDPIQKTKDGGIQNVFMPSIKKIPVEVNKKTGKVIPGAALKPQDNYNRDVASKEKFLRRQDVKDRFISPGSEDFKRFGPLYEQVRSIIDRLLIAQGLNPKEFQFFLADTVSPNAYVVNYYNTIVLNLGSIRMLEEYSRAKNIDVTENALAWVLSHEILHIMQNRREIDEGRVDEKSGFIDRHAQDRGKEYQSDLLALWLMDRAGLSVKAAPDFLKGVDHWLTGRGAKDSFWGTHPEIEERIRRLESQILTYHWQNESVSASTLDTVSISQERTSFRQFQEQVINAAKASDLIFLLKKAQSIGELHFAMLVGYGLLSEVEKRNINSFQEVFEQRTKEFAADDEAKKVLFEYMKNEVYTILELKPEHNLDSFKLLGKQLPVETILRIYELGVPDIFALTIDVEKKSKRHRQAEDLLGRLNSKVYFLSLGARSPPSDRINMFVTGFLSGMYYRMIDDASSGTLSLEQARRFLADMVDMQVSQGFLKGYLFITQLSSMASALSSSKVYRSQLRPQDIQLLLEVNEILGTKVSYSLNASSLASSLYELSREIQPEAKEYLMDWLLRRDDGWNALRAEFIKKDIEISFKDGQSVIFSGSKAQYLEGLLSNTNIVKNMHDVLKLFVKNIHEKADNVTPADLIKMHRMIFTKFKQEHISNDLDIFRDMWLMTRKSFSMFSGDAFESAVLESIPVELQSVFARTRRELRPILYLLSLGAVPDIKELRAFVFGAMRVRERKGENMFSNSEIQRLIDSLPLMSFAPETFSSYAEKSNFIERDSWAKIFELWNRINPEKRIENVNNEEFELIKTILEYYRHQTGELLAEKDAAAQQQEEAFGKYAAPIYLQALFIGLGYGVRLDERDVEYGNRAWALFSGDIAGKGVTEELELANNALKRRPKITARFLSEKFTPEDFIGLFDFITLLPRDFESAADVVIKSMPPSVFRNFTLIMIFIDRVLAAETGYTKGNKSAFDFKKIQTHIAGLSAEDKVKVYSAISFIAPHFVQDGIIDNANKISILKYWKDEAAEKEGPADERSIRQEHALESGSYCDLLYSNPGGPIAQLREFISNLAQEEVKDIVNSPERTLSSKRDLIEKYYPHVSLERDRWIKAAILSGGRDKTVDEIEKLLLMVHNAELRDKLALGAFDQYRVEHSGDFRSLEEALQIIQRFFPSASLIRDDILSETAQFLAKTRPQYEQVRQLYLDPFKKTKDLDLEDTARVAMNADLFRKLVKNRSSIEKTQFLLWLMGITEIKPFFLVDFEYNYHVNADSMRDDFGQNMSEYYPLAGLSSQREALEPFLYGEKGIFNDKAAMSDLLGGMFDSIVKDGPNKVILRKIYDKVFEKADQSRREEIFLSLVWALSLQRAEMRIDQQKVTPEAQEARAARLFLESLGLVGRQIAQVLARSLWMTPVMRKELSKVQDSARRIDKGVVFDMLDKFDLADDFETIEEPLGSAKIAGVYRAKMKDGRIVALKVKRPEVDKTIEADLVFLRSVFDDALRADFMAQGMVVPDNFLIQIEDGFRRELDFEQEASNTQELGERVKRSVYKRIKELTLRKLFGDVSMGEVKGDYDFYVPQIIKVVNNSLIYLEYIEGVKLSQEAQAKEAVFDQADVELALANELLREIFYEGFYHGDPHLGNILVQKGKKERVRIVLIDAGASFGINKDNRRLLGKLMVAVRDSQRDALEEVIRKLGGAQSADIQNELEGKVLQSKDSVGQKLLWFFHILEKNHIAIPDELLNIMRFFATGQALFESDGGSYVSIDEQKSDLTRAEQIDETVNQGKDGGVQSLVDKSLKALPNELIKKGTKEIKTLQIPQLLPEVNADFDINELKPADIMREDVSQFGLELRHIPYITSVTDSELEQQLRQDIANRINDGVKGLKNEVEAKELLNKDWIEKQYKLMSEVFKKEKGNDFEKYSGIEQEIKQAFNNVISGIEDFQKAKDNLRIIQTSNRFLALNHPLVTKLQSCLDSMAEPGKPKAKLLIAIDGNAVMGMAVRHINVILINLSLIKELTTIDEVIAILAHEQNHIENHTAVELADDWIVNILIQGYSGRLEELKSDYVTPKKLAKLPTGQFLGKTRGTGQVVGLNTKALSDALLKLAGERSLQDIIHGDIVPRMLGLDINHEYEDYEVGRNMQNIDLPIPAAWKSLKISPCIIERIEEGKLVSEDFKNAVFSATFENIYAVINSLASQIRNAKEKEEKKYSEKQKFLIAHIISRIEKECVERSWEGYQKAAVILYMWEFISSLAGGSRSLLIESNEKRENLIVAFLKNKGSADFLRSLLNQKYFGTVINEKYLSYVAMTIRDSILEYRAESIMPRLTEGKYNEKDKSYLSIHLPYLLQLNVLDHADYLLRNTINDIMKKYVDSFLKRYWLYAKKLRVTSAGEEIDNYIKAYIGKFLLPGAYKQAKFNLLISHLQEAAQYYKDAGIDLYSYKFESSVLQAYAEGKNGAFYSVPSKPEPEKKSPKIDLIYQGFLDVLQEKNEKAFIEYISKHKDWFDNYLAKHEHTKANEAFKADPSLVNWVFTVMRKNWNTKGLSFPGHPFYWEGCGLKKESLLKFERNTELTLEEQEKSEQFIFGLMFIKTLPVANAAERLLMVEEYLQSGEEFIRAMPLRYLTFAVEKLNGKYGLFNGDIEKPFHTYSFSEKMEFQDWQLALPINQILRDKLTDNFMNAEIEEVVDIYRYIMSYSFDIYEKKIGQKEDKIPLPMSKFHNEWLIPVNDVYYAYLKYYLPVISKDYQRAGDFYFILDSVLSAGLRKERMLNAYIDNLFEILPDDKMSDFMVRLGNENKLTLGIYKRFAQKRANTKEQYKYFEWVKKDFFEKLLDKNDLRLGGIIVGDTLLNMILDENKSIEVFSLMLEPQVSDAKLRNHMVALWFLNELSRAGKYGYVITYLNGRLEVIGEGKSNFVPFEEFMDQLYDSSPAVKYVIMMKLLVGANGMLHTYKGKKKFVGLLTKELSKSSKSGSLLKDILEASVFVMKSKDTFWATGGSLLPLFLKKPVNPDYAMPADNLFKKMRKIHTDKINEDFYAISKKLTRSDYESFLERYGRQRSAYSAAAKNLEALSDSLSGSLENELGLSKDNSVVLGKDNPKPSQFEDKIIRVFGNFRGGNVLYPLIRYLPVSVEIKEKFRQAEILAASEAKFDQIDIFIRACQSLGPMGVRFLQLYGQYFSLTEETREKLRDVYDSNEGQDKFTAWDTLLKAAEKDESVKEFVDKYLVSLDEKLGGGSLVTVFSATVNDFDDAGNKIGTHKEVVKIRVPNAQMKVKEVKENAEKIIERLQRSDWKHLRRNYQNYELAKRLLGIIGEWIIADITDDTFLRYDSVYAKAHIDFTADNGMRVQVAPALTPNTPDVKREPYISGPTLNKVLGIKEQRNQAAQEFVADLAQEGLTSEQIFNRSVVAIVEDYARHLAEPVINPSRNWQGLKNEDYQKPYILHSDIHPGNAIISKYDADVLVNYLIDRNFYLKLSKNDVDFVRKIMTSENIRGDELLNSVIDYFLSVEENNNHPLRRSPADSWRRKLLTFQIGAKILMTGNKNNPIGALMVILQELELRNVKIPLNIRLVFKNIFSIQSMLRDANAGTFADYIRDAEKKYARQSDLDGGKISLLRSDKEEASVLWEMLDGDTRADLGLRQEEDKFHKERQDYWMSKGFSQQEAHVIASAEQVEKFALKGKLTPYHLWQIERMEVKQLEAIIEEYEAGRQWHYSVLEKAKLDGAQIDLEKIKVYEKGLFEKVKVTLERNINWEKEINKLIKILSLPSKEERKKLSFELIARLGIINAIEESFNRGYPDAAGEIALEAIKNNIPGISADVVKRSIDKSFEDDFPDAAGEIALEAIKNNIPGISADVVKRSIEKCFKKGLPGVVGKIAIEAIKNNIPGISADVVKRSIDECFNRGRPDLAGKIALEAIKNNIPGISADVVKRSIDECFNQGKPDLVKKIEIEIEIIKNNIPGISVDDVQRSIDECFNRGRPDLAEKIEIEAIKNNISGISADVVKRSIDECFNRGRPDLAGKIALEAIKNNIPGISVTDVKRSIEECFKDGLSIRAGEIAIEAIKNNIPGISADVVKRSIEKCFKKGKPDWAGEIALEAIKNNIPGISVDEIKRSIEACFKSDRISTAGKIALKAIKLTEAGNRVWEILNGSKLLPSESINLTGQFIAYALVYDKEGSLDAVLKSVNKNTEMISMLSLLMRITGADAVAEKIFNEQGVESYLKLYNSVYPYLFKELLADEIDVTSTEINMILRLITHFDSSRFAGEGSEFEDIYNRYKADFLAGKIKPLAKNIPVSKSIEVITKIKQEISADAIKYYQTIMGSVKSAIEAIDSAKEEKERYKARLSKLAELIENRIKDQEAQIIKEVSGKKAELIEEEITLLKEAKKKIEGYRGEDFPLGKLSFKELKAVGAIKAVDADTIIKELLFIYALGKNEVELNKFRQMDADSVSEEGMREIAHLVDSIIKPHLLDKLNKDVKKELISYIKVEIFNKEISRLSGAEGELKRKISIYASRGWLAEYVGYYSDECWTGTDNIMRDNPETIALIFMDEQSDDIIGGTLLMPNEVEGKKVLIDRGLSPRIEFTAKVNTKDFVEKVMDYEQEIAKALGAEKLIAPLRSLEDGLGTNNPDIIQYYQDNYGSVKPVNLGTRSDFNGHDITTGKCVVLREWLTKNTESKDLNPGGIDLNPGKLDIEIIGEGINFDVPVDLRTIQIDGFSPMIIQIIPADIPEFLKK